MYVQNVSLVLTIKHNRKFLTLKTVFMFYTYQNNQQKMIKQLISKCNFSFVGGGRCTIHPTPHTFYKLKNELLGTEKI